MLLKQAYTTLSDISLREVYDIELAAAFTGDGKTASCIPERRAAQVIGLDEFEGPITSVLGEDEWTHACRCGEFYRISEEQLENDIHLVACEGCSEAIWVGFEAIECLEGDS